MMLNESVKTFNFQQIKVSMIVLRTLYLAIPFCEAQDYSRRGYNSFYLLQLVPLEIGKEFKTVKELEETTSAQVLEQHTGTYGAVCFVVRRPGCYLCREEGRALSQLAIAQDSLLEGFGLFGVVKETGVDDEGLTEFYSNYFTYPLYRDVELSFYKALGNRKLTIPWWNPWKLVQGIFAVREMNRRLTEKNISGNLAGEGFLKGGLIIFGKDGTPRYAYEEETGSELPVDDIKAALKSMKVSS
jgi:hypothetical protein